MPPDLQCDPDRLVELLQHGDIEALDHLTRCFGDRMLSEARRRCRTSEEADDAVQDASLNAWRYGPGFRGEGRVDRWLVRLVATACARMRRGLKNDPGLHIAEAELVDDDASPELLAARSQLAGVLGEVLGDLSPRDRAILMLTDGEGWTSQEVADALDMTAGAVRTRLSRAHKRMRAAVELVAHR